MKPLYLWWKKSGDKTCLLFPRDIFQVVFHHQLGKTFSVNCGKFTFFFVVSRHTHGSYRIDNLIVQGDAQKTPLKTRGKNWSSSGGEASRKNEQSFTPLKTITNDWLESPPFSLLNFGGAEGENYPSEKKVSIFNRQYMFNWWFLFHCHSLR